MPRASRALSQLEAMGFSSDDASHALRRSNGDVQRAVEILTTSLDAAQPVHNPDGDSKLATLDELLQQAAAPDEDQNAAPSTDENQPANEAQGSECKLAVHAVRKQRRRLHDPDSDASTLDAVSPDQQVKQPARKRRARAHAKAAGQPTDRSVQSASAVTTTWQWLAQSGWQTYDSTVCEQLESSFSAGLDRTQVRVGSSNEAVYVVDFDKMLQYPELAEWRRRKIRRCVEERAAALPSRKPRHRQPVLVSSDDSNDSNDDDFECEPTQARKQERKGAACDESRPSKLGVKRKPSLRKKGKATDIKGQPSLASFLQSAKDNRTARRDVQLALSQHVSSQRSSALQSGGDDGKDEIDDIEPSRCRPLRSMPKPAAATVNSELWTDKYAPQTIEALAVHKSGIERVRGWMRESLRGLSASQQSVRSSALSVLVLKGPPGSGKTSLVRLLATELQCSVREWCSPVGASSWNSEERLSAHEWRDQHRVPYEGSLEPLEHFLLGAAKYGMLPGISISSTSRPLSTTQRMDSPQEIILIDELPQLAKAEHRERFHALVRTVAERARSPVVFILSSHRTASSNGSMADATTASKYFPDSLLSHPQVTEHKLLEVNKTSLEKTLRAINLAESSGSNGRAKGVGLAAIKEIVASCHGDVRAAVHSLQFASVGNRGSKARSKVVSSSNAKETAAGADGRALGSRDVRLDMFRALGKILYNKRVDPSDEKSITALDAARHAAAESRVRAELRRLPTKDAAEDIIDSYDVDWPQLCEQLQQNYIEFFTQIEDLEVAAAGLSNGALIGGWQEDKPTREMACSIAAAATVRAVRWANTAPSNATFRPFRYTSNLARAEEQTANWRGADSFLISSGVAGNGETTVRSRQTRFEVANYVQFMDNNGGLPTAPAATTANHIAEEIEDAIEEIE